MILVLIHHIHLLMYVPTIAAIVVLRHYLVAGRNPAKRRCRHRCALALTGSCCSSPRSSTERWRCRRQEFVGYLQGRMADPSRTDLLSFSFIWYQPLAKEIRDTWARLPSNMLGVPVFALLIWLHTPLWQYFAELIRRARRAIRIVASSSPALVIVSAGYLIMFAIVFDYSRWISNWAVCMFLILHAVKMLAGLARA